MAGCCAGLAAWTKNEGLAFAFAASVMVTVGLAWRRGSTWRPVLRRLAAWGMGLAIPLAFVLHHKLTVAGATDLAAQQDLATLLARATDPGRWSAILSRFAGLAWSTPGQMTSTWSGLSFRLPLIVLLIALVIVQGLSPPAGLRRGLIVGLGSLGLLALAVFTALLLTPHDLTWHLDAAAYRMPVMFYPSVLMLIFVSLRAPPACEPSVGRG